jgi:hypothetical protein
MHVSSGVHCDFACITMDITRDRLASSATGSSHHRQQSPHHSCSLLQLPATPVAAADCATQLWAQSACRMLVASDHHMPSKANQTSGNQMMPTTIPAPQVEKAQPSTVNTQSTAGQSC